MSISSAATQSFVDIIGARVHNLKNISLSLPHGKLIVVTGVSGSGKSSLIFHVLYAESQRRYISTLESSFVRNFVCFLERPEFDRISGLQSVVGIGQEINQSRTMRSTVGTLTDIYSFLRLLYARVADAYSYVGGTKMIRQSEEEIIQHILTTHAGKTVSFFTSLVVARRGHYRGLFAQLVKKGFKKVVIDDELVPITSGMQLDRYKTHDIKLVVENEVYIDANNIAMITKLVKRSLFHGKGTFSIDTGEGVYYFSRFLMDSDTGIAYRNPMPSSFSFNSSYGACPNCKGCGKVYEVNQKKLVPDPKKSISEGAIPLLGRYKHTTIFKRMDAFLRLYGYSLQTPVEALCPTVLERLLYGSPREDMQVYLARFIFRKNDLNPTQKEETVQLNPCPECRGQRLRKEALHFKLADKNIASLCHMSLDKLYEWMQRVSERISKRQAIIAASPLAEVKHRLKLLLDMGLHYLTLDRGLDTLSGGEIRRIRIASQIGTQDSQLVGVMYIFDEPSIGLHAKDSERVIAFLRKICDEGNTVIVIEHDKSMMLAADYLVEIGPGAGKHGGEVVAAAAPKEFLKIPSATADFLNRKQEIAIPETRRSGNGKKIMVKGCTGHTLKNVDITIPLGKFIVVTGVSGSGKSSLVYYTLVPLIKAALKQVHRFPLPYKQVTGCEHIDKIVEVTQSPIGRTQRSNVATYTGIFDLVRTLFTELPQSKIRGYKPRRFSFNVKGGRCENCKGVGAKLIEMDFLPSIRVPCEVCEGLFYNRETLEVQYKGKSIADILAMTVEQALAFFAYHPKILQKLRALESVGLGYIHLSQHATTLSGGEAQRVKLASELTKKHTGNTLYILNEPTTGLHFQDVKHLLNVLHHLTDQGNTVVCIAHNLDLIKVADHVIDLGLDAGDEGGYIVAQGTPEEVANQANKSYTGAFLRGEFQSINPAKTNTSSVSNRLRKPLKL